MTIAQQLTTAAADVATIETGTYPAPSPAAVAATVHALADQVAALPPVAPPPPPPPPTPPPPGGHIAQAIAGLAPSELRPVKLEANEAMFKTAAGYWILDWTPFGAWDAASGRVVVGGRRFTNKVIEFDDAAGQWQVAPLPAVLANDPNQFGHWYGETIHDGAGIYMRGQRYEPASGQWGTPVGLPSVPGDGMGASYAYFPTAPQRFIRYAGDGGHRRWKSYDPATQQTTVVGGLPCGDHAILCYHPQHDRVLMVGGDYSGKKAARVTRDGAVTPCADLPGSAAVSMEYKSWVAAHPAGCWLVRTASQLWAYWPTGDAWQQLGAAPDAALQLPVVVPGYAPDVLLIVALTGLYAWRMPELAAL